MTIFSACNFGYLIHLLLFEMASLPWPPCARVTDLYSHTSMNSISLKAVIKDWLMSQWKAALDTQPRGMSLSPKTYKKGGGENQHHKVVI